MADEKLKMAADVCSYVNENDQHIHLEICVPGVNKEAISLKIRDDSFSLFAPRDDFDYVSAAAFCCPVHLTAADLATDTQQVLSGALLGLGTAIL